jgi:two-component system OmpR family response regulator
VEKSIAIVDDDARIRELLSAELKDEGYTTTEFSCAEEILGIANEAVFGLIFLDLLMPGIGGIECLRSLRKKGINTKVIIFTALCDPQLWGEAYAAGATICILKSDLLQNLPALLQIHLESR